MGEDRVCHREPLEGFVALCRAIGAAHVRGGIIRPAATWHELPALADLLDIPLPARE